MTAGLAIAGPDSLLRCPWALGAPEYLSYHDEEWGKPVRDDTALFERLSLEAFQSGLSWLTILRKRENFRAAFNGFDIEAVAAFGPADLARLLADAGIVRNRAKIEATIANARAALGLPMCQLRRALPRLCRKTCAATASDSPALSRRMPRCRRAALSTTTLPTASAATPEPGCLGQGPVIAADFPYRPLRGTTPRRRRSRRTESQR